MPPMLPSKQTALQFAAARLKWIIQDAKIESLVFALAALTLFVTGPMFWPQDGNRIDSPFDNWPWLAEIAAYMPFSPKGHQLAAGVLLLIAICLFAVAFYHPVEGRYSTPVAAKSGETLARRLGWIGLIAGAFAMAIWFYIGVRAVSLHFRGAPTLPFGLGMLHMWVSFRFAAYTRCEQEVAKETVERLTPNITESQRGDSIPAH